jgi:hypothetical protein
MDFCYLAKHFLTHYGWQKNYNKKNYKENGKIRRTVLVQNSTPQNCDETQNSCVEIWSQYFEKI